MEIANTSATVNKIDTVNKVDVANNLDKDSFLQILVSQLQNQDPLSPMEDKDFIAQMAQFSVLEQMQALNAGFNFSQASSLVGKNVYARTTAADGSEQEIYGKVASVMTVGGAPFLEVNGSIFPYSQNLTVYAPAAESTNPQEV